MSFLFEGPNDAGRMMLKGELTIQHGPRFKEVLLDALDRTTRLSVVLEGIKEIDLACLQVLCSAHKTAIESAKEISIAGRWPEAFRKVVAESGYERGGSCRSPESVSCLWKSEGMRK